jgi:alpha-L-rhamnosidase
MWEKWDAIRSDDSIQAVSLNHYAFGSIGSWMYENIAGIKPAAPGYKQIIIQPHVGGGLTWARGSYDCKYGKIVSEWKISGKRLIMNVIIPPNTTAIIYVPGKDQVKVGPGKYVFKGIF